jgi:hypothetical protein
MTGPRNLPASVRERLLQRAKREQRPFDEVLTYYAMERFLYRVSRTQHVERLVLKGALMLPIWGTSIARATRDIDMSGRSPTDVGAVVQECLAVSVEPDGLEFRPQSVVLSDIRKDEPYGGTRATFEARLENARIRVQVDVGFGDPITPGPVEVTYPTLLDQPAPRLWAYPVATTIAEKLNAIVELGLASSRLKDYFDLWSIARVMEIDGDTLVRAIRATFGRRGTPMGGAVPVGLTPAFGEDASKRAQWSAFTRRIRAQDAPPLDEVVTAVAAFLGPVLTAAAEEGTWGREWGKLGRWMNSRS